jgi:hypothetical protein
MRRPGNPGYLVVLRLLIFALGVGALAALIFGSADRTIAVLTSIAVGLAYVNVRRAEHKYR